MRAPRKTAPAKARPTARARATNAITTVATPARNDLAPGALDNLDDEHVTLVYAAAEHPKNELYADVYDPFTRAWFAALDRSDRRGVLLAEASSVSLLVSMRSFDHLFRDLVDEVLADDVLVDDVLVANDLDRTIDVNKMVDTVDTHRAHVLWVGHAAPGPLADTKDIKVSLSEKFKRNISLGVVEALICLHSACEYGRTRMGLRGVRLEQMLRRSRQLYASLAALHDDQEQVRLSALTGIEGCLMYPETDYDHVLRGEVTVGLSHFVEAGTHSAPRLRFAVSPVPSPKLDSPIKRCPAQRLKTEGAGHPRPLNDVLWDLLVDIYRESGSLD